MISRFLPLTRQVLSVKSAFSTATMQRVNYYDILGVDSGATSQQIHQAYNKIASNISPSVDPINFQKISEAFVILTNNRSRDAFDSLLRAQKVSYLNDVESVKITQKSYIAQRRQDANKIIRKQMNIDQFGRYKGGLPTKSPFHRAQVRGSSANSPGEFATRIDIQSYADKFPEYNIVDSQVAESFKSYHQKDRRDRAMKQPWFNLQVDYDFFTFKNFRKNQLPILRLIALFGFALPVFWVFIDKQIRLYEQEQLKKGPAAH